jgi:hypothetical protein
MTVEARRGGVDRVTVISGGAANPIMLAGTVDPSAGGGVAAPEGSLFMRYVAAGGEQWKKTGVAATAWTKVGDFVWTDDGTYLTPANSPRRVRLNATGNARGVEAVDLQQTRSAATEVAAATRSFIAAGRNNRLDGGADDSFAYGDSNQCTPLADYGMAGGKEAYNRWLGARAHASGQFNEKGDAQSMELVARVTTNDTNPHVLTLDGIEPAAAANSMVLPNIRYAWIVEARLIGGYESGGLSELGAWILRCAIGRRTTGANVDIRGPVEIDELVNQRGDTVDLIGNNTLSSLEIQVTPGDATLRKWVAHVRVTQFRWFAF